MNKKIQGHGGGGGGKGGGGSARAPVEAPDSLRSKQYAYIIDALCEGEIEGLINGSQSVYLNDTPLQNSDGSLNFNGFTLSFREGSQTQPYIEGFSGVESEVSVGVQIKKDTPIVRSLSNQNLSAVRITIGIPQLTYQDPNTGDLGGTSVAVAIDVQDNGGGWVAQPMRYDYSQNDFIYTLSSAYNAIESSQMEVQVNWAGVIPNYTLGPVNVEQKLTVALQYRIKDSSDPWLTYQTHTFSGRASYVQTTSGLSNPLQQLGVIYAKTQLAAPSGNKTFSVSLPSDQYEFRLVPSGTGTVAFGGGRVFVPYYDSIISGKTTSRYQRSYRIDLVGDGPWDIRVRRLTDDSTKVNLVNDTYFESFTEIIDVKLSYPNTALVGIVIDSSQFSDVPTRGYLIKGAKVRIPSNYDPLTRQYTGIWDGTFDIAWTDNPAWVYHDMIVEERYGLGEFIGLDQIDKWALYEIAQYCDEQVPDGFGGYEPRFTANLYLQQQSEAYDVIGTLASIFRSMVYWSAGQIFVVQDAPSEPVAIFSRANIIGDFDYSGSSRKTRHTVCLVGWNDPSDQYRQKIEYVEDEAGIRRYGVVQTNVTAVGCTSRGQAHRIGKWLLYSERNETETITFKTGLDGQFVAPGSVFKVMDTVVNGQQRVGGRNVSATKSSVVLDAPVTIEAGVEYLLWSMMPDGSIESRTVANGAGVHEELLVTEDFSAAPVANAMWVMDSSELVSTLWRCVSVTEVDGTQAEITALAYSPEKFDAVEQNILLDPLPTTVLTEIPDSPINLTITESLYLINTAVVGSRITASWSGGGPRYIFQWRKKDGNWNTVNAENNSVDIQPIDPGVYDFTVVSVNSIGVRSAPTSVFDYTIYGKLAPPSDVTNFQLAALSGYAYITFSPATDLDVIVGGHMRVRFTPELLAPEWSNAVDIGPQVAGTSTSVTLPLMNGTYMAKWFDSSGQQSTNAVSISTDVASIINLNVLEVIDESTPNFPGAMDDVVYDSAYDAIKLSNVLKVDDWPLIDSLGYIDAAGGIVSEGTYTFANGIDLGHSQTSRLTANLLVQGIDADDLIDSRPNIDTWVSIDGALITDVGVIVYVRTTEDDPAGSPVNWSEWREFQVGDWVARAFEFKCVLFSNYESHNVLVKELSITVDMPDRDEFGNDIASGLVAKTIVYNTPFMAPPALTVTAQNMLTGDKYTITGKDENGFTILFQNSVGGNVDRTFDYHAKGY